MLPETCRRTSGNGAPVHVLPPQSIRAKLAKNAKNAKEDKEHSFFSSWRSWPSWRTWRRSRTEPVRWYDAPVCVGVSPPPTYNLPIPYGEIAHAIPLQPMWFGPPQMDGQVPR